MINISDLAEHLAQCAEYAFAYKDREELERILIEYFDNANNGWIPVSERLPEHERYYNVTIRLPTRNYVEYCFYDKLKRKFYIVADGDEELNQVWEEEAKNVIAWQPLPEPYKEEEEWQQKQQKKY